MIVGHECYSTENFMNKQFVKSWKIQHLLPVFLLASTFTMSATATTQNSSMVRRAEAALRQLYTRQAGVPIDAINCPNNANFRAGGTFECQAKAQGVNFKIQVKMEDDQGKFDSYTKGLLILTKIEDLIKKTVKERANINVTADCGGKVRPAIPGNVFTCQVRNRQGETSTAQVTVKDERGNINVKL